MPNKTRNANRKKNLKKQRKSRRQQKKIKCIMCEKNTCKKIEFHAGVMFGKKHEQVASSVLKMLVGPKKRIRFGNKFS